MRAEGVISAEEMDLLTFWQTKVMLSCILSLKFVRVAGPKLKLAPKLKGPGWWNATIEWPLQQCWEISVISNLSLVCEMKDVRFNIVLILLKLWTLISKHKSEVAVKYFIVDTPIYSKDRRYEMIGSVTIHWLLIDRQYNCHSNEIKITWGGTNPTQALTQDFNFQNSYFSYSYLFTQNVRSVFPSCLHLKKRWSQIGLFGIYFWNKIFRKDREKTKVSSDEEGKENLAEYLKRPADNFDFWRAS